jgi:hypothetical protein
MNAAISFLPRRFEFACPEFDRVERALLPAALDLYPRNRSSSSWPVSEVFKIEQRELTKFGYLCQR